MNDSISIIVKPKINIYTLSGLFIFLIIFTYSNAGKHLTDISLYFASAISIIFLIYILWAIAGRIRLIVLHDNFHIIYSFLFIPFRKDVFEIRNIKSIKKLENVKSDDPISWTTYRIGTISYTPKSSLIFMTYPVLLQIKYFNDIVFTVGKGWQKFDADAIVEIIRKKQLTINYA